MRSRTAETALDEPPSIRAASATPRPDTTRQSGGFFARGAVATRRPADHCPAPVRHPRAHSRLTRRRRTKALGLSATMSTWPLLPHRLAVGIGVCVALFFLTSSCASDAVPSKGEPHFTGERAGALEPGTVSTDAVAAMAQRTAPLPETGFAAARPAAEETTVEPVPGLDSSPPPSTSAPPIEPAVPEAPAEDPAATSTLASQDVEGPLSSADSDSSVPLIEEPQPEEPGPEQPQPEEPGPEQPQPEEPGPDNPRNHNPRNHNPRNHNPSNHNPRSLGPSNLGPRNHNPRSLGPSNLGPSSHNPRSLGPSNLGPSSHNPRSLGPSNLGPSSHNPRSLGPSNHNPRSHNPRSLGPRNHNPRRRRMTVCGLSMMPSTRQRRPPRPIRPEWGWWQPPAI